MSRLFPLFVLVLAGCDADLGDLHAYVRQVQANPPPYQARDEQVPGFEAVRYRPMDRASPFQEEQPPEQPSPSARPGCLGPLPGAAPPLARVALDSLVMRGTLQQGQRRWALVEGADGRIHRLREGDRLGLFGGRITRIGEEEIELVERVEQGAGCYVERHASLSLQIQGGEKL